MSPYELKAIASARDAAKEIGELFRERLSDEKTQSLAMVLLEEISNYDAKTKGKLAHEMQLGMLEALIPDVVFDTQNRLNHEGIKKDNQAQQERPAR